MKPLRSIDEEDDAFVSRGYDRSLPRFTLHLKNIAFVTARHLQVVS